MFGGFPIEATPGQLLGYLMLAAVFVLAFIGLYWTLKYCNKEFLDGMRDRPIGSLDSGKRGRR